jgi:small subunit ribosomal protein S9
MSSDTTPPAEDSTPPAEPAKHAAEPTKHAAEPTKHVAEPTGHTAEPAKHPAEPTKSAAEPAKHVGPVPAERAKPVSERSKARRDGEEILGTGRRKTAVARVRLRAGGGKITVNGRDLEHYFPSEKERSQLLEALVKADRRQSVDLIIRVDGGGPAGQAGACKLGIARALRKYDSSLDELLRHSGLLTRDGRMKERKHYGLRGARRGTQFSKR